jgi:hypothetical protein
MPLDPVIAQGFRGIELQNPLDAYTRVNQLQQAQQQNQLNALKMQEYQRESAATNALNQAYQAAYNPDTGAYDMNRLRGEVIRGGAGAKLPGIEKQMGELRTQQFAQGKAEAEAVTQKLAQSRALLDTIDPADPSAPQRFMAWHEVNHADPVLGPVLQRMGVTADQSRARISQAAARGPQALADLIAQSREGQTKFAERFKPITVAPGVSVYRPGDAGAMFTAPAVERLLSPEEEAQKVRIAQASRPPVQPREPREPSAPVAVVDEATGKVRYVSREEAMGKTPATALEGLAPKEIQKREAALPQATSSVKSFEYKTDQFIKELIKLRDDPGLDQITGSIYGRTPSVSREGSRAQALYNKIFAKGGFQALQDLREASKTGGALGNVSNQEGERLERSVVGGLDRTQNKKDVQNGINDLIADLEVSKQRVRAAFDDTYQYKQGAAAAPAPTTPAAPAAQPIYARNPTTGQRIMSVDGGNNWTPAR